MELSCSCDFDSWGHDEWWSDCSGFQRMGYRFATRKRCCSCKSLINVTEDVIEFYQYRATRGGIEEQIYDESEGVPVASSFMCETCSGLYLALDELGYGCLDITEPMVDYIAEYNQIREYERDNPEDTN